MKRTSILCAVFFASIAASPALDAAPKKKAKAVAAAAAPAETKETIVLDPHVPFGLTPTTLATHYDRILENDFKPLFKGVGVGVRMAELEAELGERKAEFRRSRVDFERVPTAYDNSPLRGEFTYDNGESLMSITRSDQTRHFFFIKGHLWKIIDELALGEKSPWGATLDSATARLAATYGAEGRKLEPSQEAGRTSVEFDWADATTHLRAVDRGGARFALIAEDKATLEKLPSLRTVKPTDAAELDPSVAAAIRRPEAAEPPKAEKKTEKK